MAINENSRRDRPSAIWCMLIAILFCVVVVLTVIVAITVMLPEHPAMLKINPWHRVTSIYCDWVIVLTQKAVVANFLSATFMLVTFIAISNRKPWQATILIAAALQMSIGLPAPYIEIWNIMHWVFGIVAIPVSLATCLALSSDRWQRIIITAIFIGVFLYFPTAYLVLATGRIGTVCDST